MNKKIWLIVGVLVIIGAVVYISGRNTGTPKTPTGFDPANATYIVEGQPVKLVNGTAEIPVPADSATTVKTSIFGQPTSGDINNDGVPDAALILVQSSAGSGTFYYVAAAINASGTAEGTNAILLGDRIAPQTLEISNGQIIANYADRKPGEPMAATPSVGVSKFIIFDGTELKESPALAGLGEHCGGNMVNAPLCAAGLHCAPSPQEHLPFGDVGGVCTPN